MLREFFSGLLLGNEEGIGKNLPVKNLSEFSNRFNKVLKIKSYVVLPFLPVGFGSHTVFLTSRGGRSRDRQHRTSPQSPGIHAGSTRKKEATIKW